MFEWVRNPLEPRLLLGDCLAGTGVQVLGRVVVGKPSGVAVIPTWTTWFKVPGTVRHKRAVSFHIQTIRQGLDTVMSISSKQGLRDEMRARRRALSAREQNTAGKALVAQLRGMPGLAGGQRFAAYLANDGEIDPLPMMRVLIQRKRRCFLPIIVPLQRPLLRFGELKPDGMLKTNRFGILEPQVPPRASLKIGQLDWVFVPLVAFDRTGNRLGMGGGFYDATLDVLRHRRHGQRPRLIGLAHEFQRVNRLNVDSWDVPLHGIVTDCGYYAC